MRFNIKNMSTKTNTNLYQKYKKEYSSWRENKNFQEAKRREYLRRNPDAIKDYDLQRAKILLNAVDIRDKSISKNSNHFDTAFESLVDVGLGYAAIGGTALGFLFSKLGFVKRFIDKITKSNPKSKNLASMAITVVSGVLGILASYPLYNKLISIESTIHRKRKMETMERELQDPKVFAVLDSEQKELFEKNLNSVKTTKKKFSPKKIIKNRYEYFKQISNEALYYEKNQSKFNKKYEEDTSFYEKDLTPEEIKNAKKDKALLLTFIKEVNTKAQSYSEKMQRITDNLITASFALGSLFTLGYERIAKTLKMKTSALPAGMGVLLIIGSTFFATWAQKRASHVGKYIAKQDLMQNPEKLVYISTGKTDTIEDNEIEIEKHKSLSTVQFLKEFFKYNKEYQTWKKSPSLSGSDISEAMKNINLSPEQISDGKRLQKNMFKTFYKTDKNTQKYSSSIQVMSESIKYPITLILGSIGSIWGMKHLTKLRESNSAKEILIQTIKYIGTISLFTIPSMILNSYFAKAQKMGARISDMMTMKELEDYRFFADYSRFKSDEVIE